MSILRMLQSLPVYVVTGKTEPFSTNAAGYFPIKDEGTLGTVVNAATGLPVTVITDVTGLVAYKDYIPVMEYAGSGAPYSAGGYVPCKLASGAIFNVDEHIASVVSLTHFDGTNGSATITDEVVGRSWSFVDLASTISTAQSKFGTASANIKGIAAILADGAATELGSGDFTIEVHFYAPYAASIAGYSQILLTKGTDADYGAIYFALNTDRSIGCYVSNAAGNGWAVNVLSAASAWSLSTWHHVALSRTGNELKFFLDGVQIGATMDVTGVSIRDVAHGWSLGGPSNASTTYAMRDAFVDEFRLTKGVGRYTANFTPPTSAWVGPTPATDPYFANVTSLLHFDGNDGELVFTDVRGLTWAPRAVGGVAPSTSTAQKKFGTASLLTPGTYGLATSHGATPFVVGTADFCVELQVYPTSTTAGWLFYRVSDPGGSAGIGLIWSDTSQKITALASRTLSTYEVNIPSDATLALNTWHHVALTRSAGVWRLFINGQLQSTTVTDAASFAGVETPNAYIGDSASGGIFSAGYIDEFRFTKGVARYSANFTPPTAAFPNS